MIEIVLGEFIFLVVSIVYQISDNDNDVIFGIKVGAAVWFLVSALMWAFILTVIGLYKISK